MLEMSSPDYQEYKLFIGDSFFEFMSDFTVLADRQTVGSTMHSHKFYEMLYILYGSVTVHTEYGDLHLNEGDYAIIGPGVTHSVLIHPQSRRLLMAFFLKKNQLNSENKYYQTFQNILQERTLVIPSFVGANAFKRLTRYLNSNYPDKNELITSCLHEIMVLVKTEKTSTVYSIKATDFSDSNNYRDYLIDEYFTSQFQKGSLIKLSELLHLSTQQTQRIIKGIYNQTFMERMTIMRMEHAKKLLLTTSMSATKIAEACGYKGTNGFFVAFKKYFGITPKELRKEHKQNG